MGLLDDLCCLVRRRAVVEKMHAVIDSLEVFFNRKGKFNQLVHSLIVGFKVRGHDFDQEYAQEYRGTILQGSQWTCSSIGGIYQRFLP